MSPLTLTATEIFSLGGLQLGGGGLSHMGVTGGGGIGMGSHSISLSEQGVVSDLLNQSPLTRNF